MNQTLKLPKTGQGFTIAELMLASSVFSVVLLVTITGFLEIGHLFYKGVSTTQTQNISKQLVDDIVSGIQTADSGSVTTSPGNSAGGYTWYCVGDTRYTVNQGNAIDFSKGFSVNPPDASTNPGTYGIIRDVLPGGCGGTPPCDGCGTAGQFQSSTTELLGNKMRLENFEIDRPVPTQNLYTVTIKIAYGDDDVFDNVADPNSIACKGNLSNQQFCAVESISTSVYQGAGL